MGSGAKYMRKGFRKYEKMRKYFTINEEAVSQKLVLRVIYDVRPTRPYTSVPKLETGTPKLLASHRKSKNYSRVEFITRPTECPTQPRRTIDANRVYTFI